MHDQESLWFSPAYLLSRVRTSKASTSAHQFENSTRYQKIREMRAALVAAASLYLQTGDCIFIQSARKQDDPPDIRLLRITQETLKKLPCIVTKDTLTIEEIEVTTYSSQRETKESLQQQLRRTKWREGYDFNGILLVETDSDSLHNIPTERSDISKALWLIINSKSHSKTGTFFISIHPEQRKLQINVGRVAAKMRELKSPDVLVMTNYGVKHRELMRGNTM